MKHILKRGSTRPALRYPLPDGVDLADAQVTFLMAARPGQTAVVNAPATIASIDPPVVEYVWRAGDTATSQLFLAEFEVAYPGGAVETFPQSDYLLVEIIPDLGDAPVTPGPISAAGAVVESDMDLAVGLLTLGLLAVTLTGAVAEAEADTATGALIVQSGPAEAPLRTATAPDAMTIHSGHSLTDTFFQGGAFPGVLHGLRESAFGAMPTERTAKSTIPGSSTRIRWEAPAGSISEVHARYDIGAYDLMTITERGLDVVGVAPHYVLDDPGAEQQISEDLEYLWRFVDNARRNGDGGAGAESLLWAIWPAIDGSMGDFRTMLDAYEPRWHYRQEIMNRWLADAGETRHPYMHVIPGHRLMARIYDDIQAGLVPGVTSMQDLFSDNIHPNHLGVYAIGCLVFAVTWQQNPEGLAYQTDPPTPDALRSYFQRAAWEIATTYARAGLGGPDMGAPGILAVPVDVDPAEIPNLLYASEAPIQMDGQVISTIPLQTAGSAGNDLYAVLAVTPAITQPKVPGVIFQVRSDAGESMLGLTYRQDLGAFLLDNGLSGGNHANHRIPAGMMEAQAPLILEMWLDGASGLLRGLTEPSATNLTPSTNAAAALRFGTADWGGEVMAGTIHGLAVFDRVPTDEERVALRAWAHERAGVPFMERAIPARPSP